MVSFYHVIINNQIKPLNWLQTIFACCIFQKMDLNGDGVVSMDEFLQVCLEDESISRSITAFANVSIWNVVNVVNIVTVGDNNILDNKNPDLVNSRQRSSVSNWNISSLAPNSATKILKISKPRKRHLPQSIWIISKIFNNVPKYQYSWRSKYHRIKTSGKS